ncbi:MAG: tRNA dihydrouridine(20/20a) synthase DusA [Woeseiaceae bacterium]|nr:tRNA dihydrouridine(20/20a) synthase DusA [Woeseiaceae bacterium]
MAGLPDEGRGNPCGGITTENYIPGTTLKQPEPKISVAPMMDWTDRHCRYFLRQLSPSAHLYTEMITAAAIEFGDRDALLRFDETEHPVAVQLGGSKPAQMALAAAESARRGYDEININVGCPSDRVQNGQFGACLMAIPEKVADCYVAMADACDVPITVKTRIGIDDQDSYEYLARFVDTLAAAGCREFIVHARIAILNGLSPKDNRTIPPLNYDRVFRLKREMSELQIMINGGIVGMDDVATMLNRVDGVMIGRKAYHDPYFLAELESHYLSGKAPPSRRSVVKCMLPYIERELAAGEKLGRITRHMLGLFAGQPGARQWRRTISENAYKQGVGPELLQTALDAIPEAA